MTSSQEGRRCAINGIHIVILPKVTILGRNLETPLVSTVRDYVKGSGTSLLPALFFIESLLLLRYVLGIIGFHPLGSFSEVIDV
jgi:hypothetical protein